MRRPPPGRRSPPRPSCVDTRLPPTMPSLIETNIHLRDPVKLCWPRPRANPRLWKVHNSGPRLTVHCPTAQLRRDHATAHRSLFTGIPRGSAVPLDPPESNEGGCAPSPPSEGWPQAGVGCPPTVPGNLSRKFVHDAAPHPPQNRPCSCQKKRACYLT